MRKLGLALLLAIAPIGAAQAQAPCGFSGSGGSGSDCLGQTWTVQNGGWGIPGIFAGTIPFNGTDPVTQFSITFNPFGTFDGLIGFGDGLNDEPWNTRFGTSPFGVTDFWTVSGAGNSVTFTAQGSSTLSNGQFFFVNVEFLNGLPLNLDDVSFTANWGPAEEVVPEPATMTLLATGLAGMAAARRRKKQAA